MTPEQAEVAAWGWAALSVLSAALVAVAADRRPDLLALPLGMLVLAVIMGWRAYVLANWPNHYRKD